MLIIGSSQYILTQPFPSLRIMFVSPSLRLPGVLRTPLFTKIDAPQSVLSSLSEAFRNGVPITERVTWMPRSSHTSPSDNERRRHRWIRCTPLLGNDDRVGVWMIIIVPVDSNAIQDHEERHSSPLPSPGFSRTDSPSPSSFRSDERSLDSRSGSENIPSLGLGLRRPRAGRLTISPRAEREENMDMYAEYLRSPDTEPGTPVKVVFPEPRFRRGSKGSRGTR